MVAIPAVTATNAGAGTLRPDGSGVKHRYAERLGLVDQIRRDAVALERDEPWAARRAARRSRETARPARGAASRAGTQPGGRRCARPTARRGGRCRGRRRAPARGRRTSRASGRGERSSFTAFSVAVTRFALVRPFPTAGALPGQGRMSPSAYAEPLDDVAVVGEAAAEEMGQERGWGVVGKRDCGARDGVLLPVVGKGGDAPSLRDIHPPPRFRPNSPLPAARSGEDPDHGCGAARPGAVAGPNRLRWNRPGGVTPDGARGTMDR